MSTDSGKAIGTGSGTGSGTDASTAAEAATVDPAGRKAEDSRRFWDEAAERFDDEPDHGLRDPGVRDAWAARLRSWLPAAPSDVLDLGCGTGSLALLAAGQGHRVTAVDRSERMAERARAKLAGTGTRVFVADAALPPVAPGTYDVVLVRHLLWALPEPEKVLRRWAALLRPGGRLVLVEGRWGAVSPVGIPADTLAALAAPLGGVTRIEQLGHAAALWGRAVDDERYAAVVSPAAPPRHTEIVDVHLVLRRGGEVLLARRAGTGYADGLLHAPSGHLEEGEDVRAGMIREAAEEIGVHLAPEDLRAVLVMQHRAPSGHARIGWFFEAELPAGAAEPVNREPHKCSGIGWYPLDDLPRDMVAYCRAGLEAYRTGRRFVLHLHEPDDPIAHDPAGPDRVMPL
ncbi:methyltransferase domain-containing protein [Actinacidiphila rubida]|uniref:NUDIX domain-containing protein n=1 Tax=Actinacidiphila rubida TaxID=310780 RepID=A0A1H8LZH3_9ACTN|nr:methyltransferase domain-containing protein [Actinacidiphila rubida]SEO10276.1 NUDIX domain-containing protein [Actinacidiphila rubida]